jgi:aryl sulfotransferase
MHNHHAKANAGWYGALNDTPGLVGAPIERPPESVHQYFLDWLAKDGHPFWPFWENIRSWWQLRQLPNVLMVHFEDLKRDMPAGIRRIATFVHKGENGRWRDTLTKGDVARYEERALAELGPDCARWLAHGGQPGG